MRWTVIDNEPSPKFPIYGRGNMGEVYPNVMTPLTGSLVHLAARHGQEAALLGLGFLSRSHIDDSDGGASGVFGGYLYGNLSMMRVGAARAPGMSAADVDEQMFGVSDAPAYVARPDDRSLRCTLKPGRRTARALFRPARGVAERDRASAAAWITSLSKLAEASDQELVDIARALPPRFEEMMARLLYVSALAGFSRAVHEQLTRSFDDPDVVNQLTAGLGTIESAEPAFELWKISRLVSDSAALTALFDAGVDGLATRLTDTDDASDFRSAFEQFRSRFGSRGPDEWELASSTWATDPEIALAAIDRLRHAPIERDPERASRRLASTRAEVTAKALRRLRGPRRMLFRRALDAAAIYAATREATKATFVRCLEPTRLALHELARRHDLERTDLFLLTIDELPRFLAAPEGFLEVIAERRATRDFLQDRVPPFWFEGELPPPTSWLQRSAQRQVDTAPRTLSGMGVCSGVATGTARVITDPASPGELEPGDILFAPITDPAWTPLFLAVAGVVVDVGAQLSHAAIIARELGIPAVVSVAGASSTIADGALVTVDGTNGTVTIHPVSRGGPRCWP